MSIDTMQPKIMIPRLDQAEEMILLRRELFREECIRAGVDAEDVWRHTADWGGRPTGVDRYQEYVEEWLDNPEQDFCRVVMVGEAVAGLCVAHFAVGPEDAHHVASIQLTPAIRRRGIGRALLEEFWNDQFADPAAPVRLNVLSGNTAARAFYDKLDFRVVGDDATMDINGKDIPLLTMERS